MDDLIVPSTASAAEPEEMQGNLFSTEYEVRPSGHEME
jgi:hypothetical protein